MACERLGGQSGAADVDAAAPAMAAVNLTLGFAGKTVLDQVSMGFPARAVTSLMGPTGSGKTTFLRTLNRMNDKVSGYRYSGDVLLGGRSIFNYRDVLEFRRRVGMLFQRPNPFPMSIMDNVLAGVRAHKLVPRKEFRGVAQARLTEVGLWDAVKDRLSDSPFRLSGGQQQLLCLARTLAVNPEVLLLDEPTSALDPTTTEKIEEFIRSLADRLTVIIVTHNLAPGRPHQRPGGPVLRRQAGGGRAHRTAVLLAEACGNRPIRRRTVGGRQGRQARKLKSTERYGVKIRLHTLLAVLTAAPLLLAASGLWLETTERFA